MTQTLAELGRSVDRIDRRQDDLEKDVHDNYVRRDVYSANERARDAHDQRQDDRIKRREDEDTTKLAGTRSWLLGLVQMLLAAGLGVVTVLLTAKSG